MESTLYGMVTAEFYTSRILGRERLVVEHARSIVEKDDNQESLGSNLLSYSELVVYCKEMQFNWELHKGVPQHYKNLETWWKKIGRGETPHDCYLYFSQEIELNPVITGLMEAMDNARKIWTPEVQLQPAPEENAGTDDEKN
jgi:hypothetical protein